mmetsp:Transcript_54731/g.63973  ORF Transcript_54731/g.63973 Transcript_54731/m.63973 type:complete len:1190 (-) Transcript_54731:12-3581(-)
MTYTSGIIAATLAPILEAVGFLEWDIHWKNGGGSAFALNLYKCNVATLGFVAMVLYGYQAEEYYRTYQSYAGWAAFSTASLTQPSPSLPYSQDHLSNFDPLGYPGSVVGGGTVAQLQQHQQYEQPHWKTDNNIHHAQQYNSPGQNQNQQNLQNQRQDQQQQDSDQNDLLYSLQEFNEGVDYKEARENKNNPKIQKSNLREQEQLKLQQEQNERTGGPERQQHLQTNNGNYLYNSKGWATPRGEFPQEHQQQLSKDQFQQKLRIPTPSLPSSNSLKETQNWQNVQLEPLPQTQVFLNQPLTARTIEERSKPSFTQGIHQDQSLDANLGVAVAYTAAVPPSTATGPWKEQQQRRHDGMNQPVRGRILQPQQEQRQFQQPPLQQQQQQQQFLQLPINLQQEQERYIPPAGMASPRDENDNYYQQRLPTAANKMEAGTEHSNRGESDTSTVFSKLNISYLILSSLLGIVIGDSCELEALRLIGARRVLLLDTLKPFAAALLAKVLLGETLYMAALLGMILAALGVYIVIMHPCSSKSDDYNSKSHDDLQNPFQKHQENLEVSLSSTFKKTQDHYKTWRRRRRRKELSSQKVGGGDALKNGKGPRRRFPSSGSSVKLVETGSFSEFELAIMELKDRNEQLFEDEDSYDEEDDVDSIVDLFSVFSGHAMTRQLSKYDLTTDDLVEEEMEMMLMLDNEEDEQEAMDAAVFNENDIDDYDYNHYCYTHDDKDDETDEEEFIIGSVIGSEEDHIAENVDLNADEDGTSTTADSSTVDSIIARQQKLKRATSDISMESWGNGGILLESDDEDDINHKGWIDRPSVDSEQQRQQHYQAQSQLLESNLSNHATSNESNNISSDGGRHCHFRDQQQQSQQQQNILTSPTPSLRKQGILHNKNNNNSSINGSTNKQHHQNTTMVFVAPSRDLRKYKQHAKKVKRASSVISYKSEGTFGELTVNTTGTPGTRAAKSLKRRLRRVRRGYGLALINVLFDGYGAVLTKQYGLGMSTWEINLIRIGFAAVVLTFISFFMRLKNWYWYIRKEGAGTSSVTVNGSNNYGNCEGRQSRILNVLSHTQQTLERQHQNGHAFFKPDNLDEITTTTRTGNKSEWYCLPQMPLRQWIIVSIGVVFVTFLCPALTNYALFEICISLAVTLNSLTPLFTIPLSWGMKGEKPDFYSVLGASVSMAGVIVLGIWGSDA